MLLYQMAIMPYYYFPLYFYLKCFKLEMERFHLIYYLLNTKPTPCGMETQSLMKFRNKKMTTFTTSLYLILEI